MGKYTELAKKALQEFKPGIERKTGIRLEDIIVEQGQNRDDYQMETDLISNTIFINEGSHAAITTFIGRGIFLNYNIKRGIIHEASHLVHKQVLLNKGIKLLDSRDYTKPSPPNTIFADEHRSFTEGFACYMVFDYLKELLPQELRIILENERKTFMKPDKNRMRAYGLKYDPYERGYKFFRYITSTIGQKKVLEIAGTLPLEKEISNPRLYLTRIFPNGLIDIIV